MENQTFGEATLLPGEAFEDVPADGILGLSWPSIAAEQETPLFQNMISQKLLQEPKFAFYLKKYVGRN